MLSTLTLSLTLLQLASGPSAVLQPGLEGPLLRTMKGQSEELPPTWALRGITVDATEVRAHYGPESAQDVACEAAPLCVTLRRPADPSEALGYFSLSLSGSEAERAPKLLQGLRQRLPNAMARDPWKLLNPPVVEPAEGPSLDPSEAAFKALLGADPALQARLLEVTLKDDEAALTLRTDDGPELIVRLTDRPPHLSNPAETTASFHVRFEGGLVDPPDLPTRVLKALKAADQGALRLKSTSTFEDHRGTWLHDVLWWIAACLIALIITGIPSVLRACARQIGNDRLTWGIIALGVMVRLVVEARMIEFGIGVMLTDYAQHLIMPRYGPSVPALHHGLFLIFGSDHEVVLLAHRVLGCLMLPLTVAGGLALFPKVHSAHRWFAPIWTFGLAFTPMLVRAEATESNLQPALFAFWFGLVAWMLTQGRMRLLATIGGLGFAMLARPELVLIVPAAWLLLCRPWAESLKATLTIGACLTAIAPFQLTHILQRTLWEVSASSLAFDGPFFRYHLWVHLGETALIEPRIAPLATPLLALVALAWVRDGRARIWSLALGGLTWIAVYAVDLSSASAPRLHVAGLQAWTLLAAIGATWLVSKRGVYLLGAGALWCLSAAFTIPWLYAPTNEDTEARLLARLQASVEQETTAPLIATLQHTDSPDVQGHGTHRYFPTYRFPQDSVIALGAISAHLTSDRPLLLYQGVNCYAELDRDERGESGLLKPCADAHERLDLEPIWVEDVPNFGNPRFQELGYYGEEPTLKVGLWRVRGP